MYKPIKLCSILVLLVSSASALAQQSDRDAILALMEEAFAAVASQEPDDWRKLQVPEGTTLSFSTTPGDDSGLLNRMSISNNADYAASRRPGSRVLFERWIGEPTVMINGPIASVWGEYDFWIDGEFSHCGVDAVALVKTDDQWKIVNWMWTVERTDCSSDPR